MKKILSLCLAVLAAVAARAATNEDLMFCDADGNTYADGTVLVLTDIEDNLFGEDGSDNLYIINSNLYVTNTTEELRHVVLTYTISEITRGTHSCCFPSTCVTMTSTGSFESDKGSMKAGVVKNMITEWYTGGEGSCTVTYTLHAYQYDSSSADYNYLGEGPTITVQYVYSTEDTSVSKTTAKSNVAGVEYFDVAGCKVKNPKSGLFIRRTTMTDGTVKTQKVIIKN